MQIDDLSSFLSKYGDRIAVQAYCKDLHSTKTKKMGLVQRLKQKLRDKKKGTATMDGDSSEECIFERQRKNTRQIEIGWICDGKQVRTKCGGDTRKVQVNRSARKNEILELAKKLLFLKIHQEKVQRTNSHLT